MMAVKRKDPFRVIRRLMQPVDFLFKHDRNFRVFHIPAQIETEALSAGFIRPGDDLVNLILRAMG